MGKVAGLSRQGSFAVSDVGVMSGFPCGERPEGDAANAVVKGRCGVCSPVGKEGLFRFVSMFFVFKFGQ